MMDLEKNVTPEGGDEELVEKENLPCYVSLEERMGCGIGACLVCVCDMTNGQHARVCKDGPVFNANGVVL